MTSKSPITTFGKELPPPANWERVGTQVTVVLCFGVSETTGMAVRVTKFDATNYSHEDSLSRVYQSSGPEILLCYICKARPLSRIESLRLYVFDHG